MRKRPTPPPRHRHGDPIGVVDRNKKKRSSNGLVATVVGIGFVGYVFNAAGLQTGLNGFFQGLDQSAHRYEGAVVSSFVAALPLVAALGLAFLGFILYPFLRGKGSSKPGRKKAIRKAEASVPEQTKPTPVERVWVRPRASTTDDAGVAILVDTGRR